MLLAGRTGSASRPQVAFLVAIWLIRALRHSIDEEADLDPRAHAALETLPLHLYNTVIQQLKQQKHELQVQTQAEQRRARTTENFSQAVLSNLSSGVLVFGVERTGEDKPILRPRQILGFRSPSGMSVEDIFRGAAICSANVRSVPADGIDGMTVTSRRRSQRRAARRQQCRQIEADYRLQRARSVPIAVTVSPVPRSMANLLGAACLINDRSELERIRTPAGIAWRVLRRNGASAAHFADHDLRIRSATRAESRS